MTPLQKLQTAVTQLQEANLLEVRDLAVSAMDHIVELALEITTDAEMSNRLMQSELDKLSERVRALEAGKS